MTEAGLRQGAQLVGQHAGPALAAQERQARSEWPRRPAWLPPASRRLLRVETVTRGTGVAPRMNRPLPNRTLGRGRLMGPAGVVGAALACRAPRLRLPRLPGGGSQGWVQRVGRGASGAGAGEQWVAGALLAASWRLQAHGRCIPGARAPSDGQQARPEERCGSERGVMLCTVYHAPAATHLLS